MPQAGRLLVAGCALTCLVATPDHSRLATASALPSGHSPVVRRTASRVLPGIDVLLRDSLRLVEGKRVGLITNQAGVDAAGVPTIDRLAHAPGVRLVALFAPEHGIRAATAPGGMVRDTVDAATGLPIYSLYGASRAPAAAVLARLDVLVIDLQDVGARPYTYVSTTILAMRAAAAAGVPVIVLDRPDPIGCAVQGPVLDTAYASFIGLLPVPLRHGMTLGELARFANARLAIGAALTVVPVAGWQRCEWFDATGLTWVPPSPNLPDLASVAWYPGTVLFEATNLSVGRGTGAPFRQVGAPWLDAARVARAMARRYHLALDTVSFVPRESGDGKYDGIRVAGLRFPPPDRRRGDPVRDALHLLLTIRALQPGRLRIDTAALARRLGRPLSDAVTWPREVAGFLAARRAFLLY
jgi:uncharacterized protein YbbC (DUF1343 family)